MIESHLTIGVKGRGGQLDKLNPWINVIDVGHIRVLINDNRVRNED